MGSVGSKSTSLVPPDPNWGRPADHADDLKDTRQPTDLVFQAWAYCKAKPSLVPPTGKAEIERQNSLSWRGRQAWMELNCGDDSFFLSEERNVIGIADGVGGWRSKGVDPSLFANALMGNSKLFCDTHRSENDPEVIAQAGYAKLLRDAVVDKGSSTVCCATLMPVKDGRTFLDVLNLGDSGCMVLRNGESIFKAEETTHRFNFPRQLTVMPMMHLNVRKLDNLSSASRGIVNVQRGDVVVMGTDGLFDNRFDHQLIKDFAPFCSSTKFAAKKWFGISFGASNKPDINSPLTSSVKSEEEAIRLAQASVEAAYTTSQSRTENTPWSIGFTEATTEIAKGGKPDDITVLVARVVARADLEQN